MSEPTYHGYAVGYSYYGCRCPKCTEAIRVYRRGLRARPVPATVTHGTLNAYTNHGCRCDECKLHWSTYLSRNHPNRNRT